MKYVFSVAKTYLHRGKHRHKSSTKKRWFIYYYDEDQKFRSEQVSFAKAMYYKKNKFRRISYICTECGKMFVGLVKSKKQELPCPFCEV